MKALRMGALRIGAPALGLACLAASAAADAPAIAPRERALRANAAAAEVPRVLNGEAPAHGLETWRLEELWRIGGDESDPPLGLIGQVIADAAGRLYLLDKRLGRILVLSPEGELLRTLGGGGDGQVELQRPHDICFLSDSTIGVAQLVPGIVLRLAHDGTLVGEIVPQSEDPTEGARHALHALHYRGGNLVICSESMSSRGGTLVQTRLLGRMDEKGDVGIRYLTASSTRSLETLVWDEARDYFVHLGGHAVGPDGRVYAAPERDRYEIQVFHPTGVPERVIERAFAPRPRSAAEKQRAARSQRLQLPGREVEAQVSDTDPCILQLRVDEENRLWALSSRGGLEQPEGIFQTFDLFDAQGLFERQVAVACPGEPGDRLFWPGGDLAILVRGIPGADRCEAICLRIVR